MHMATLRVGNTMRRWRRTRPSTCWDIVAHMLNSTYGAAWIRRSTHEFPAVLLRGRLFWVAMVVQDWATPVVLNSAQMSAVMPVSRDVIFHLLPAPDNTHTAPGWQGPAAEMPAPQLHWVPLECGMHATGCAV